MARLMTCMVGKRRRVRGILIQDGRYALLAAGLLFPPPQHVAHNKI